LQKGLVFVTDHIKIFILKYVKFVSFVITIYSMEGQFNIKIETS